MASRATLAAGILLVAATNAHGDPDRVFTVNGRTPPQVMVTLGETIGAAPGLETLMGRAMAGVLVEPRGQLGSEFRRLVERRTRPRESSSIERRVCVVWLLDDAPGSDEPQDTKRVEIGRTAEGWLLAREIDTEGDGLDLARLDGDRFHQFAADWPAFRGEVGTVPEQALGVVTELPKPYTASRIVLDDDTLRRRIFGAPSRVDPLDRVLEEERMLVRLPVGYDPGRPAGLLIWISPLPSAEMPLDVLLPALDELGLIAASIEDAGNTREMVDRCQLVLDCHASIAERFFLDDERVYMVGMSGGGRLASTLWGCFPDVFTGAVAIVGLNSYDPAPTGTGKYWPRNFIKPRGRDWAALRQHRLAAITGREDYNAVEIGVRIEGMRQDGLDVSLVDQPGLGHAMPSAEVFAEAITWVDTAAMERITERDAEGQRLLETARTADEDARERLLIRVLERAPWSPAAFEAYEMLRTSDDSGD